MKLLIVEDDENNIALFEGELAKTPAIAVTIARSRDSAENAISTSFFDLIVIDLKIPAQDSGLDSEVEHGLAVHALAQEHCRGTPIIVFSAFGTLRLVSYLAEKSEKHDIWGSGVTRSMTIFKEKSDFLDCLKFIQDVADEVGLLAKIEISTAGQKLDFSEEEARLLRVFSRILGGTNVRVAPLGGGLSDARTFRIEVQNAHGAINSVAVAKLGPIKILKEELLRYNKCVAPSLGVGGFAHFIRMLEASAGGMGGLFYAFAKEFDRSFLDVVRDDPQGAAGIVQRIEALEKNWTATAPLRTLPVGEIRKSFVEDNVLEINAAKLGFDWRAVENVEVSVRWSCQHRDLHGLNVLIRNGGIPLFIDYGEVDAAPCCLDPLVLELSLLFHPACIGLIADWPTREQVQSWRDVDTYTEGTPLGAFVKACRKWSFGIQPSDRGVFATIYGYSLRQLKYSNTNHDFAIILARMSADAILL